MSLGYINYVCCNRIAINGPKKLGKVLAILCF